MKKWLFRLLLWLPALPVRANLPKMEDPSRGQGDGIMETLQNYGYDIVILMTLGVCAVGFLVVANNCIATYSEIQGGRKQWKDLGAMAGGTSHHGRWLARLKRGRPESWLYRALELKLARFGIGAQRFVLHDGVWAIRRSRR
ncbi:TIGR03745 family integrating conjugative element membrane protein [Salmonella enterica subsp. diarizonae]|nr:TIGR03745 family integrating conjugative element membrane protein [Salmonella enterica subsp. diarizonae]